MLFNRSRPRRLLLSIALFLPLLSTACATASTKASRARMERPDLPPRPGELARTERLKPLSAVARAGDEVTISRTVLEEVYTRLGEAIGAVERGNARIVGNNRVWACTATIFTTGKVPAECSGSR